MRRPRCQYYNECKERVYPGDPEAPYGKCKSLCDVCYSYNEALVQPIKEETEWVGRQWDAFTQLRSEVTGWRQKHAEILLELNHLKKRTPTSQWE